MAERNPGDRGLPDDNNVQRERPGEDDSLESGRERGTVENDRERGTVSRRGRDRDVTSRTEVGSNDRRDTP
jgi:hypothetical protein